MKHFVHNISFINKQIIWKNKVKYLYCYFCEVTSNDGAVGGWVVTMLT